MIAIVDFGSQTTHLIGRRLRQMGIKSVYIDSEHAWEEVKNKKYSGVILSGGPASVYANDAPDINKQIFDLGLPVLGICYGWQIMAKKLGGRIENTSKEYGPEEISYENNIFNLARPKHTVFMSHGDSVVALPAGFRVFASTKQVKNTVVVNKRKNLFGLQFHPEVDHTEYGQEVIRFFSQEVCKETIFYLRLEPKKIIQAIKDEVGEKKVICAVSGGVDSTVAAYLMSKAIGENLLPVYVRSGLMRSGMEQFVGYTFKNLINTNLIVVDAQRQFETALKGVTDPEKKRKIIGKLYVEIFQREAEKYPEAEFLGQGTIYSDVIESKGSKKASKIKSHHNVGGLPKNIGLRLLEPLRHYYKDEVRQIGKLMGLPEEVVFQQPFPGPGYAIRIRGKVTSHRLNQIKIADEIIVNEMKLSGLYKKVFQCFAVMTGAFSTAIKGDARVFAEVVALRAYESRDVMTSQWAHIPYDVLQKISSRIVNEVPDVSRVVYDITTKPPATMEWE